MRLSLAVLLALLAPVAAAPQSHDEGPPTGFTTSVSLAGGGELGLDSGRAGILELEAAAGWELEAVGVRPELGVALGVAPDTHFALRPGVRWTLPRVPIQLRVAIDVSNARDSGLRWRWLLVGAAAELRFTSLLGLYAGIDTGAPLGSEAGVPLLVRAGASLRF
jgi:hypothetical protein